MNTKTIIGTTSSPNLWTYKIVITETATDTINRTSTIKVEHFLGRKSGAGSSYFEGAYTIKSVVAGETKTSNKSMYSGTISAGGWKSIGSHTFTVSNTGNPTNISISGQQTSSIFNPSSSNASGTMDLTVLHIAPKINSVGMAELNTDVSGTGLHPTIVVYYLSKKKFSFNVTAYEGATITTYNVYANDVLVGTSATNEVIVDFKALNLATNILKYEVEDSLGSKTTTSTEAYYVNYSKPTLEMSTTTIKRKSSSTVGITDSYATLRLNGNYYKGNNEIGNNNTITKVEYKIWNTTEPSYTDITSSATIGQDGTITISGLDIYPVDFRDVYNYKIVITDYFGNQSEIKEGTVPTGLAIWTEFSDRVDFVKLTVNNNNPFEYSTSETKVGLWTNGKPIYRKVINDNTSSGDNSISVSGLNIDEIIKIEGTTTQSNNNIIPLIYYHSNTDFSNVYYRQGTNELIVRCGSSYGYGNTKIILEYTKTIN